jgi:hypothetical protein
VRRGALAASLLACACGGGRVDIQVDGVEPNESGPNTDVIVTIRGTFAPRLHVQQRTAMLVGAFSARLGDTELEQVVFVDRNTLRAVVPAGLSPGSYTVTVRDPRESEASLEDAFTLIDPDARKPGAPPIGTDSGGTDVPVATGGSTSSDLVVDATYSLQQAIDQANADGVPTVIRFTGPTTVTLTAPLPPLTEDGTTIIGGEGVVVDGTALTGDQDNCFTISSSNNRIEQIEIKGCFNNGVEINLGGASNVITRCNIHDIGDEAIDSTGSGANNVFSSNVIEACGGRCIELDGPSTRVLDNILTACPNYEGLRLRDNAAGSEVIGNVISSNGAGVRATELATGLRIYHNTIVRNAGEGLLLETSGHDVRNNILNQNSVGIDAVGTIATLSRNTYFENADGECTNCPAEPDRVSADPGFIDEGLDDFRLAASSPCLDAAVDLGLDRNGPAPGNYAGVGPDIGALERY